ncbi:MAG: hypothetical protein U5L46_00390 [Agrobacterium sp.]|nr:hypothetical protein [Agrobacterium sp.]
MPIGCITTTALERERIHLLLLDDARRGLADAIASGRTFEADGAIGQSAAPARRRPPRSPPRRRPTNPFPRSVG